MKKIYFQATYGILLTAILFLACNRTAVNPAGVPGHIGKWTCFYYSTCPANPMSAAPCYQYQSSDTAIFDDGAISLQIGNSKIYRSFKGSFKYTPYSYLYSQPNDTLTYQQLDSFTLIVLNGSHATNTIKITPVTDSVLVLKYVSSQFNSTVETDSLRK